MLMLFPVLKIKGLSDIDIHLDHQDPELFYALRNIPRISTDAKGNPLLSFVFIARNAKIAYASSANKEMTEDQLGQLLLTTDMGISKEEADIIVKQLADDVMNSKSENYPLIQFSNTLRNIPNSFFMNQKRAPNIRLGSVTWNEGVARLNIMEGYGDTFKKQSSAEIYPSLGGSNTAAFYATFGVEGSQMMYDALTKGYSTKAGDKDNTPLYANVMYNLKGNAFIPNCEIKVRANSSDVYNFFQSHYESYCKDTGGRNWFWVFDTKSVSENQFSIDSLVEKMTSNKIIKIEMTDYGSFGSSSEAKDFENQIKTSMIGLITNTIIPLFFNEIPFGFKEEAEDISKTSQLSDKEKGYRKVQQTVFALKAESETKNVNINLDFKKNGTVEFMRNPQGSLSADLTPEQRKNLIQYIDISSPEVQPLVVQVHVNANFATDNIHSVVVNLSYKQKDAKSGVVRQHSESFMYKTGDETNQFRVTMARNEKGELFDFYDVEAKIQYKGTAEAPPPIKLANISDKSLVISYDKLGFLSVDCRAGDIDWSVIKEAIVYFEYPPALNKPDAKKQISLTRDNNRNTWTCYMYGNKQRTYNYKVKYINHDGREIEGKTKSDSGSELLIDDLLTDRLKASFDVILDTNTVKNAKIDILYQDTNLKITEEYSRWFEHTESWDWTMRLQEGAVKQFKYRYIVNYQDNIVTTSEWFAVKAESADLPVIHLRRYPKSLFIDAGMVDWDKWDIVYVSVSYKDDVNNYAKQSPTLRLDKNNFMQTFEVLAFESQAKPFKYSLRFAKAGGSIVSVEEKEESSGLLLIQSPANV